MNCREHITGPLALDPHEALKRLSEANWRHHLAAVKGFDRPGALDEFFRTRRAVENAEREMARAIARMR